MSMSDDNLVCLRRHEGFYAGVISNYHQQWLSKVSIYLNIPIILRVITIWDELFWNLGVSFDVLVTRKKVSWESSHCIEIHCDVFVEVLEVHSSVSFEFCLDEELIEFGDLISCFKFHMPPFFVDCPMSNGEALLLYRAIFVQSVGFGESFCVGEDSKVLIWSMIAASIALKFFVSFIIFSSESCLLDFISFLLDSITACTMMNCSLV